MNYKEKEYIDYESAFDDSFPSWFDDVNKRLYEEQKSHMEKQRNQYIESSPVKYLSNDFRDLSDCVMKSIQEMGPYHYQLYNETMYLYGVSQHRNDEDKFVLYKINKLTGEIIYEFTEEEITQFKITAYILDWDSIEYSTSSSSSSS
jgi:hypothetical protein